MCALAWYRTYSLCYLHRSFLPLVEVSSTLFEQYIHFRNFIRNFSLYMYQYLRSVCSNAWATPVFCFSMFFFNQKVSIPYFEKKNSLSVFWILNWESLSIYRYIYKYILLIVMSLSYITEKNRRKCGFGGTSKMASHRWWSGTLSFANEFDLLRQCVLNPLCDVVVVVVLYLMEFFILKINYSYYFDVVIWWMYNFHMTNMHVNNNITLILASHAIDPNSMTSM